MAVYLISYDLNKQGQNYSALYEAIKFCASSEPWHGLDSTWIIKSSMSASSISNKIREATDTNDRHLVVKITNDKQGWLKKDEWSQINSFFE